MFKWTYRLSGDDYRVALGEGTDRPTLILEKKIGGVSEWSTLRLEEIYLFCRL